MRNKESNSGDFEDHLWDYLEEFTDPEDDASKEDLKVESAKYEISSEQVGKIQYATWTYLNPDDNLDEDINLLTLITRIKKIQDEGVSEAAILGIISEYTQLKFAEGQNFESSLSSIKELEKEQHRKDVEAVVERLKSIPGMHIEQRKEKEEKPNNKPIN